MKDTNEIRERMQRYESAADKMRENGLAEQTSLALTLARIEELRWVLEQTESTEGLENSNHEDSMTVRGIIKNLNKISDSGARRSTIIRYGKANGLSESDVDDAIEKMMTKGIIYEPDPDCYRIT